MARPREFDEDRAIEAAMRAFWATGYEATSTQDLCAATGIGRSSIYNTFHSKRDLFERALRRYMATKDDRTIALLESDAEVHEKVWTLFSWVVDAEEGDPLGCLVVNSMVERPDDQEIADLLRRNQELRLGALRDALDAGRRAGEIGADRDPAALAQFVVATINGMQVLARGGADRTALEAIATTALTAI
jgi:AcrR family transcriptional regulator